jgi:hypothetical protein
MKTGATRKAEKKSGGGGTVGGTSAFNADPIAERALIVGSIAFFSHFKSFDFRLFEEISANRTKCVTMAFIRSAHACALF